MLIYHKIHYESKVWNLFRLGSFYGRWWRWVRSSGGKLVLFRCRRSWLSNLLVTNSWIFPACCFCIMVYEVTVEEQWKLKQFSTMIFGLNLLSSSSGVEFAIPAWRKRSQFWHIYLLLLNLRFHNQQYFFPFLFRVCCWTVCNILLKNRKPVSETIQGGEGLRKEAFQTREATSTHFQLFSANTKWTHVLS